jgi:TP901 family phage tail tape measure protein
MADADLTQELGFDASAAIASLQQLDNVLASSTQRWNSLASSLNTFNTSGKSATSLLSRLTAQANAAAAALGKLNSGGARSGGSDLLTGRDGAEAMNKLLGQTGNNSAAAVQALNDVGKAAKDNLKDADDKTKSFTISFETLARVVATQAIVRALSAIRNSVSEAFSSNLEFVKSLSEIQTIDAGHTIDQLSTEVRGLSDAFNIPLLDAAKAKYEILSNGFTTASEQADVFAASVKFAKTAVAETSTAVDLLSGTLNAYGLSGSQAEDVAAKFFKTVDLGKTIGSELATSFGRVAPVAASLGVSIEELDASFSTITIAGVKTSEAATQIRAALTALLKPSDAAKEAFEKLGVENGQQLLDAKGLQGAFEALISTTNGQSDAIAKLFPNVRALNAVLRLTGTGADVFKSHLEQISSIKGADFNKIYQLRIDTNAEKVQTELNKLSNFLTADLGKSLVSTSNFFYTAVGGADTLTQAFKSMIPAVEATIGALVSFIAVASIVKARSLDMSTGLAKFGAVLGVVSAAVAAFSIGDFLGNKYADAIIKSQDALKKAQDDLLSEQDAARQTEIQGEQRKYDTISKAFHQFINDSRKSYNDVVKSAQEANEAELTDTKGTLDRLIQAREQYAKDLARVAGQIQENISGSKSRQSSAQNELADAKFNFRNSRFDTRGQIFGLQRRAQDIASQAARQLSGATNRDQQQEALSQFGRASSFAQQAQSIAQANGNLSQQASVEKTIEGILQQKIAAEQRFQQLQQQGLKKAQDAAAAEQKRVDALKKDAETVLNGFKLSDKKGKPLSAEERSTNIQNANGALQRILKSGFDKGSINVSDLLNFNELQNRLNSSVTGVEVKQLHALPSAIKGLNEQITNGLGSIDAVLKLTPNQDRLKGLAAPEALREASSQFKNLQQQVLDQQQLASQRNHDLDAAQNASNRVHSRFSNDTTLATAAEVKASGQTPTAGSIAETVTQYANLVARVQEYADALQISDDKVQALTKDVGAFVEKNGGFFSAFNAQALNLAAGFGEANEARAARNKVAVNPQSTQAGQQSLAQNVAVLDQIAEVLGVQAKAEESVGDASNDTLQKLNAQRGVVDDLTAALQRQAQAAERAAALSGSSGVPEAESFGGMPNARHYAQGGFVKYFDRGGFASRGTDTIPAMLTPGEMVVNAASTRKFFPQLQAINAGVAPKSESPNVVHNHFNVGDVIVQGKSEPVTPRAIGRAIQREIRRGTLPNKFVSPA